MIPCRYEDPDVDVPQLSSRSQPPTQAIHKYFTIPQPGRVGLLCNSPQRLSVGFRLNRVAERVRASCNKILLSGKVPVIEGGSVFHLNSLLKNEKPISE